MLLDGDPGTLPGGSARPRPMPTSCSTISGPAHRGRDGRRGHRPRRSRPAADLDRDRLRRRAGRADSRSRAPRRPPPDRRQRAGLGQHRRNPRRAARSSPGRSPAGASTSTRGACRSPPSTPGPRPPAARSGSSWLLSRFSRGRCGRAAQQALLAGGQHGGLRQDGPPRGQGRSPPLRAPQAAPGYARRHGVPHRSARPRVRARRAAACLHQPGQPGPGRTRMRSPARRAGSRSTWPGRWAASWAWRSS